MVSAWPTLTGRRSRRSWLTCSPRIDVPGAVLTVALDINNRAQVVGQYLDADGGVHGYLWDKGRFTTIDVPGAP